SDIRNNDNRDSFLIGFFVCRLTRVSNLFPASKQEFFHPRCQVLWGHNLYSATLKWQPFRVLFFRAILLSKAIASTHHTSSAYQTNHFRLNTSPGQKYRSPL